MLCSSWRFGDFWRIGDICHFADKMVLHIVTQQINCYVTIVALKIPAVCAHSGTQVDDKIYVYIANSALLHNQSATIIFFQ